MLQPMHRLITIRISHYNEKARWALDRFEVPYREEPYMPMLHIPAVVAATRGRGRADKVSTRASTPVLVTTEGTVLCDSADIVRYASDRHGNEETTLYPNDEVADLERYYHDELGPHTRRFVYFHGLSRPELFDQSARLNVSRRQAAIFCRLRKLVVALVKKGLAITPDGAERSLARLREVISETSERVAGKRYLVGDRFTAADLAFSCMAAPVLLPTMDEGYGAVLPGLQVAPEPWSNLARELRDTPAGRHALAMFRHERGRRQIPLPS